MIQLFKLKLSHCWVSVPNSTCRIRHVDSRWLPPHFWCYRSSFVCLAIQHVVNQFKTHKSWIQQELARVSWVRTPIFPKKKKRICCPKSSFSLVQFPSFMHQCLGKYRKTLVKWLFQSTSKHRFVHRHLAASRLSFLPFASLFFRVTPAEEAQQVEFGWFRQHRLTYTVGRCIYIYIYVHHTSHNTYIYI